MLKSMFFEDVPSIFKNLEIIAGGDQSNRFTPKELLVKYLAFLPLFIISIILCLSIATIYTRYITPKYVANTLMYIKEEKGSGGQGDVLEKVKMQRKIQSLDDGLDTEIVEGGKNFSHGEGR